MAVFTMLCFTGCDRTQEKMIASTAGVVAAASWRAIDNPTASQITSMKGVITVIQTACGTNSTPEQTYYERIYPIADKYITAKVPVADQAMARLGAAFFLTSLDTAFAANPKWKEDADHATELVGAFCSGAQLGLNMSNTDPVITAASQQTQMRVKMKLAK